MFEVVHEFAVLGTAFFMMALATIWYSPLLFGSIWMKEVGLTDEMVEKTKPDMWKHMVWTFVSYSVMLGLLALMVAYAPSIGITPLYASALVSLFAVAHAVPAVLFEGKSIKYYGITVGFSVVFITLGTLLLQYWPW